MLIHVFFAIQGCSTVAVEKSMVTSAMEGKLFRIGYSALDARITGTNEL